MNNEYPLQGIFTPNMVPLDSRGEINHDELSRYVDWLIEKGVHGLYPNGSSGEFTRFTARERRSIIRTVAETVNGRVPILAGAAEANTKETLKACEAYAQLGARAVAIISPIFYKLSQESIFAYFSEIARHSVIDVTVYNIPMLSSPIEVETVRRLAELERIIGIKDSSGDVGHMCRMIAAIRPERPEFTFMTGWEAVLIPMLAVGANGGTNASSGIVPEVTRRLFELFQEGNLKEAMRIQLRLIELFDMMLHGSDFPDGFRAGVELRGFAMGRSRQPLSGEQTVDRDKLKATLECLIAEFGVVNTPPHCPVRDHPRLPANLAQSIAEEVARALKKN